MNSEGGAKNGLDRLPLSRVASILLFAKDRSSLYRVLRSIGHGACVAVPTRAKGWAFMSSRIQIM